jgi:hypothetical protein
VILEPLSLSSDCQQLCYYSSQAQSSSEVFSSVRPNLIVEKLVEVSILDMAAIVSDQFSS